MAPEEVVMAGLIAIRVAGVAYYGLVAKPEPLVIGTQPRAPSSWRLDDNGGFEIDGYIVGFKSSGVWSHVAFTVNRPSWCTRARFTNIADWSDGKAIRSDVLQISFRTGHFRQLHVRNIPKTTESAIKSLSRYEKVVLRGRVITPGRPLNRFDFQSINPTRWGNDLACPIVIIDSVQSVREREVEFRCDFAI